MSPHRLRRGLRAVRGGEEVQEGQGEGGQVRREVPALAQGGGRVLQEGEVAAGPDNHLLGDSGNSHNCPWNLTPVLLSEYRLVSDNAFHV